MAFTKPRAGQINFDATNISDSLIRINSNETGANTNDIGIIFERGSHTNAAIVWDESADAFRMISTTHSGDGATTDINISAHHNLHVGTLEASAITVNSAYSLPTSDGTNGQTLVTNGAGTLAFTTLNQTISLAGDSGSDTYTTGQTLTFSGGTGLGSVITDNTVTYNIDSTVATLTGTQTLTNKTLTSPTISNPTLTGTFAFTSDATSTPAMTLTANSISDGVGALRINGSQADIFLNPSTATHTTITFAVNSDQRLAFGMDNNSDFYITRRTSSTWYDDTFVLDRDTGLLSLGYGATVAGTLTYSTLNDGTTALTSTVAELNILDGVTATAAEINKLDGMSGTAVGTTDTQTLTNKTLTSPVVTTDIRLNAQAELEFYDSDSSNYVSFRAPATVVSNITWTLPSGDGTSGQVLSTNGGGTLSWADPGSGGGGSGSSYPNSTFQTIPGTDGNFDLAKNVAQTVAETPFEAGGTDAFGVNLGSVFSLMDPIGSIETASETGLDLGTLT